MIIFITYFHFHLKIFLILVENTHEHKTRISTQNVLSPPLTNTKKCGINSIKYQSIYAWNMFMGLYSDSDMATFSKYRCKDKLKKIFIDQYAQLSL